MNESGETLDSLYRYSDQSQVEETVSNWLRTAINQLERERATQLHNQKKKPLNSPGESLTGTPLYHALHPKCANPACPVAFHWTGGGKFFRFRSNPSPGKDPTTTVDTPAADGTSEGAQSNEHTYGLHGVKHYWLCEKCSHAFTLVHDDAAGVILRLLWSQLPAPQGPKDFRVSYERENKTGLSASA